MSQNIVATLKKGLQVLEFVQQQEEASLKDVMRRFNMSKSTAFRLLTTLEEMNYIYKIQTEYFINPQKFNERIDERPEKNWAGLRSVYQAAKNLQMSTYLGKADQTDLVMTQVLHAPFEKTADVEIGNRSRLHLSALGKVILAQLEDEQLERLLDKMSLERATENTFQDSQLFRYHLKAIYQEGFAFDDEERNIGVRCIAVPVFRNQKVIAALAIAAPKEEISRGNIKTIVHKLNLSSKAITKEIETLEGT